MHIQVDPALQGLFLLASQMVFGEQVRTEANSEVENKTYAPTAAKESPFDMAITIYLRSKKSRSCLNIFSFLTFSYIVFWVLKDTRFS